MKPRRPPIPFGTRRSLTGVLLAAVCLLASCDRGRHDDLQGYVEGEFVYVASPLPGTLAALHVAGGQQVKAGTLLFELDSTPEVAARDEAQRRLEQARATLEDVRKGQRPSEVAAIQAQLDQARAALEYSEREYARLQELKPTAGASVQEWERARTARDQDRGRVAQFQAQLKTASLGARADQVVAAEAEVLAREATLRRAQWDLSQKHQTAPQDAVVFDTLFRTGEQVAANRPVVALLPPQNIKVRAFIPQARLGAIQLGDSVRVTADGLPGTLAGKVSFLSPRAEYTPPVIYSKESRDKLVFMIEVVLDPAGAVKLHPGQPVDVDFSK